jgi:hypothetical protein
MMKVCLGVNRLLIDILNLSYTLIADVDDSCY